MSKVTSGLMALAILASFGMATAAPAAAAHFSGMSHFSGGGPMWIPHGHPMAMHMDRGMRFEPRGFRDRDVFMRHDFVRHDDRFAGRRFVQDRDFFFRHHRHFRDNDFFFPGAFLAGAVIGSSLYDEGPTYTYATPAYGDAHTQWCYDHYRSYRAYDNTYQPYGGPRQQCYSPFG